MRACTNMPVVARRALNALSARATITVVIGLSVAGCSRSDPDHGSLSECDVGDGTQIELSAGYSRPAIGWYPEGVPILGTPRAGAIDSKGRSYILTATELAAFDVDGQYLWRLPKGSGPGEADDARGIAILGDSLLVTANSGGGRIDLVTVTGQYRKSVPAEKFGLSRVAVAGTIEDSLVVLSAASPDRSFGVRISIVSMTTNSLVSAFTVDQTGDAIVDGLRMPPGVSVLRNMLVVSSPLRYELLMLSSTGDTLDIVSRDVPEFTRAGVLKRGGSVAARVFSKVGAPVAVDSEYSATRTYWPTNVSDPDHYLELRANGQAPTVETKKGIDVYDRSGCLVGTISPPEIDGVGVESFLASGPSGDILVKASGPEGRLFVARLVVKTSSF